MKMFKKRYLAWILMAVLVINPFVAAASQHDYEISTGDANTGVTFRAAVNAALQALASLSSGAAAPATPYAYQLWADTGNDLLKVRNAANDAWITIGKLSEIYLGLASLSAQNEFTASQKIKGDALLWRFNDTGSGGGEFGIRSDSDTLEIVKNTGTEESPTWSVVTSFGGTSSTSSGNIQNLKPVVNASVNKLDVFAKSSGAAPDTSNVIWVDIPDGTGNTLRGRNGAYASGTSQIIMADGANYWSRGSLDASIKTAWLYAIWDGSGIVWALSGYAGFRKVPTTTTATDDDYFLIEDGSSYTRSASHYCVPVIKIRYQYDTGDAPDHTIQATAEDAPRLIWNPKSDYAGEEWLVTSVSSATDISQTGVVSRVIKQAGMYLITGYAQFNASGGNNVFGGAVYIKTGSATYASASAGPIGTGNAISGAVGGASISHLAYLNNGDTIHIGASNAATGGTRGIVGAANSGYTGLIFRRVD